jgi:signal transduction histidine kinase
MHQLIHHSHHDGTLFPEEECVILRALRTGEAVHADDQVLWRANGTSFPVEYWSHQQRRGQEIVGAVVAFIDITERKAAEAALASVGQRLIEAQEQERTRIARELHDDLSQRLALLTIELERLLEASRDLSPEARSRIDELKNRSAEIASDVQSLSHELHSSKLEYLGMAPAMRALCHEQSRQHKVEIVFSHDDVPSTVPKDIALCLFRVLQEALQNAVKHSGVRRFDVELRYASDAINLSVRDSGSGFDRDDALKTRGLGLISMMERMKLVGGRISIDSQPQRGTAIRAIVPLGKGAAANAR